MLHARCYPRFLDDMFASSKKRIPQLSNGIPTGKAKIMQK